MTARPFQLLVDSGNRHDEPPTRYFGSLARAQEEADKLPAKFQPFVWISESLPTGGRVTHVRDGKKVTRCVTR